MPNLAPQTRTAFSRIFWNSGASSSSELLIAPSTSEVAVCCSSDSVRSRVFACTSSNNRTFSIAITAWSAKVVHQLDLLVVKGSGTFGQEDHADDLAVAHHGTQERRGSRRSSAPRSRCIPGRPAHRRHGRRGLRTRSSDDAARSIGLPARRKKLPDTRMCRSAVAEARSNRRISPSR